MNVVIVCRKRINDPKDFDALVQAVKDQIDPLGFDSVTSKLNYDPDQRQDGDVSFTSKA